MIFKPDEPGLSETERLRRAMVLEAPEGAVLEFDRPLDLRRADIGQLVRGELQGPITIRGAGNSPGPDDDLLVVTRDVELTERTVTTPHEVEFRLGPQHGRGRDMRITLLSRGGKQGHAPRIDGIESFELRHIERLHIEPDRLPRQADDNATSAEPNTNQRSVAGISPQADNVPVEITCSGPFRFDLSSRQATFHDEVDVLRLNPQGPSDQLSCQALVIHFVDEDELRRRNAQVAIEANATSPEQKAKLEALAKKAAEDEAGDSLSAMPKLKPYRIEAIGDPAIVNAPSRNVQVRAQRLQYHLESGQITVDGDRDVMLRQGKSVLHARRVVYQPGESGKLGRVVADGPGRLHAEMKDRTDEQLDATWQKHLHVYPHEGNQVVALAGTTVLSFRGIGELHADEIFFWLDEQEAADPSPSKPGELPTAQLRPDRMLARQNVRIQSEQLGGAVRQLEVWFEQLDAPGGPRWRPGTAGPARGGTRSFSGRARPAILARDSGVEKRQARPTAQSRAHLRPTAYHQPAVTRLPAPKQRFDIAGHVLRARVLLGERESKLAELAVEGDVRFAETETANPDEQPVFVRGDQLHLIDPETPRAAVTIVGREAMFDGRGMTVLGPRIQVNRGTNQMNIDGAGRMKLPVDRDMQGQPLAEGTELWVSWQDRMDFDGRVARFEESVVAEAQGQKLLTETLEVQFERPVRFSRQQEGGPEPRAEQIVCRGGVRMQNVVGRDGQPESRERFEVGDMRVNLFSGKLSATGPGWLSSVRPAEQQPDARGGRLPFGGGSAVDPDTPAAPFQQLHVRFDDRISGNVHDRKLTFHGNVRTVYTPADRLDPPVPESDPAALPPRSLVMTCDRLTVAQSPSIPTAAPHAAVAAEPPIAIELEATGNTLVESRQYTARANRLTYTEAKDLLVLEGDGRTDAQLYRQQQIGGPTSQATAGRIFFWPGTNRLKVDGARSLELSQFGG